MIRLQSLRNAALLLATTGVLFAADVTGKWTATMQGGPDGGGGGDMAFNFKQDGTKLTGSMEGGPGGGTIQITDGKVNGNTISFTITMGDGDMKVVHEGTINGDEISLKIKMDGGGGRGPGGPGGRGGQGGGPGGPPPGGGGDGPQLTLKRAK